MPPAKPTNDPLPPHIRALLRPGAYPYRARGVQLIQTHISYVFLVEDEVFKLKKPVDLGFCDFTTLEKRRRDCEAEVRLNRRGAPEGVYRGVVRVVQDSHGRFRVGGRGEVVDYAVRMKRLPQDRMMDRLLERGEVDFDMIGRVAARLADLHKDAERGPRISRAGGYATQRRNWRENLDDSRDFIGRGLTQPRYDRIDAFAEGTLHDEEPLLRRRVAAGWVRDCHGDLRSDAICFDPDVPGGLCIYDCIEFNDRFRYSDTGLDAAFLAMDLDYRGRPDLSDLFIGLYAAVIGDKELPPLLHFWKAYRAVVRGKVESLLGQDKGIAARERTAARRRAAAYYRLAESYARRRQRQSLVVVTGPSGSGKSVLAGTLAARLGAVLLSTDMLRRELFEARRQGDELDTGVYAPEARDRVYEEIERQAGYYLSEGRSVVVDGTYVERRQRTPLLRLAGRRRLLLIECKADDEVVRQRQAQRRSQAWTTSEGRYDVYQAQKQRFEPPDELPPAKRLVVDTTQPLSQQVGSVETKLAS
jgi:aminoglycoside phosphotransferase family enzyme/predicted kinase